MKKPNNSEFRLIKHGGAILWKFEMDFYVFVQLILDVDYTRKNREQVVA